MKCDETRPVCRRCIKSGRVCDGYKVPPRAGHILLRSIYPRPLSQLRGLSDAEGHTLAFFRHATIHQLPCAWATDTPWDRVALDLVYQQPTIAAAASACAALHRAVTDQQEYGQRQFALQQYNKSLSLTNKYITDMQHTTGEDNFLVVLVACLLYFTYEVFSGQDENAAIHLRTGLRIIHERYQPKNNPLRPNDRHAVIVNPDPRSLLDTMVHTFIRLDSDYTLAGHDDPYVLKSSATIVCSDSDPSRYLFPICKEPMPSSFSSPDQASMHLEILTAQVFDLFDVLYGRAYCDLAETRDISNLGDSERNCLVRAAQRTVDLDDESTNDLEATRQNLVAWSAAFTTTPHTSKNHTSYISTQIFFFCVWIWIETWRDTTAMDVDRFVIQFDYITGLCEQYVELHVSKTPFRGMATAGNDGITGEIDTPPAFSLGTGVVTCLMSIVEMCRVSSIRRRCIVTLQKINLKGIFNTKYLVAYLQGIVDHEEEAARECSPGVALGPSLQAHDIPETARLLEVVMSPAYHASNFHFYKEKRISLVYVTKTYDLAGNEEFYLGKKEVAMT